MQQILVITTAFDLGHSPDLIRSQAVHTHCAANTAEYWTAATHMSDVSGKPCSSSTTPFCSGCGPESCTHSFKPLAVMKVPIAVAVVLSQCGCVGLQGLHGRSPATEMFIELLDVCLYNPQIHIGTPAESTATLARHYAQTSVVAGTCLRRCLHPDQLRICCLALRGGNCHVVICRSRCRVC